jgi:hypothetical protein
MKPNADKSKKRPASDEEANAGPTEDSETVPRSAPAAIIGPARRKTLPATFRSAPPSARVVAGANPEELALVTVYVRPNVTYWRQPEVESISQLPLRARNYLTDRKSVV